MSLATAHSAALVLLRAGVTPDASAIAQEHGTSLYGAESVINDAYDRVYVERFGPAKPPAPSKRGVIVRVCQRRKKADELDRFVTGIPRSPEQAKR